MFIMDDATGLRESAFTLLSAEEEKMKWHTQLLSLSFLRRNTGNTERERERRRVTWEERISVIFLYRVKMLVTICSIQKKTTGPTVS